MSVTDKAENTGTFGKIAKRLKEFKDTVLGVPSPEEAARRRTEEELCRAFADEYGQFGQRYKALIERNQHGLGQIRFMSREMQQLQSGVYPSRDALKSAVLDEMKELDRLKDDWRTLLDDFLAFFKKPKPAMEPETVMGYVREADGIAKAEMRCSDMRKEFRAAALKSGFICDDEPEISAVTQASISVMKTLRLNIPRPM